MYDTPEFKRTKPGSSTPGQYRITVQTRNGPVEIECGEIIDALGLNFNMGEAFKAIWRLDQKQGPEYNLNKLCFFARREQLKRGHITQEEFWSEYEKDA